MNVVKCRSLVHSTVGGRFVSLKTCDQSLTGLTGGACEPPAGVNAHSCCTNFNLSLFVMWHHVRLKADVRLFVSHEFSIRAQLFPLKMRHLRHVVVFLLLPYFKSNPPLVSLLSEHLQSNSAAVTVEMLVIPS